MIYKKQINIDYLARTEGETALSVLLDRESSIELKIFEPPRFFESFLVGRKYDEVGDIVSRICGICPVSHMTTAIQAIEQANIVTPTSHNFLNIEQDLKKLVEENRHRKKDELRLMCEQLVRAYDPCFSCSVH